jgi:hypothetical protein
MNHARSSGMVFLWFRCLKDRAKMPQATSEKITGRTQALTVSLAVNARIEESIHRTDFT